VHLTEKIGKKIFEFRKQKNLSQEKLANEAGVDRTYIPKVEKGQINITINSLEKIAKALNIEIKEFFD
jgi:transcriptional regulator with XRE-family HTH domain